MSMILRYVRFRFFLYRMHCVASLRVLKSSLRVVLFGKRRNRTTEVVDSEYTKGWNKTKSVNSDSVPGVYRTDDARIRLWRSIDRKKFILKHIAEIIDGIRPETVLEMGSGNGMNVLALAILCPHVKKWCGIDLTKVGGEIAEQNKTDPPFEELMFLTGKSREDITEALKNNIRFVQGDMTKMPFGNNSFDCVFTQQAIEQLPESYPDAFREAYRVSKYGIYVESFAEAQRNFIQWLYLYASDYFRGSFRDVEKAGSKILRFEPLTSKSKHANGLLFVVNNK